MGAAILAILVGFVLLSGGAEGLVRGAAGLALRLGISSLVIGLTVGGLFAMVILYMTRSLNRRVVYRQRLKALEDKRRRGHDNIAASVFDLSAISLVEVDEEFQQSDQRCALEEDGRLSMLISTLWAKPEFYNFVNRLLKTDAGDGRMLSPEMRHELAFLRNLYLDQIDARFDQMGGITVTKAVGGNLFFIPHWATTLRRVVCTPPRSSGLVARWALFRPAWRFGNTSTGLRCTCQKRPNRSSVVSARGTKRSLLPLESRICTRRRWASISPT